jgi:hypothetical protein
MMNSFSEYMNRVKAEDELKETTASLVRKALSNAENQQTLTNSGLEFRKRFAIKKFLVAAATLSACFVFVLGGNAFYRMPINYICLDINPSVELGINAFDKVVSTQAYNEDGLQLLGDNEYLYLSWKAVVGSLVLAAAEQSYISDDGSTVIAVTAESNNEKTATKLLDACAAEVNLALRATDASAIVYTDFVNLQLRTQARETGVSPGKFRLIETLQMLDPNIMFDQFKNAKVTDLITSAGDIIAESAGEQNDAYAVVLEKIRNAAQQVQAAYGNTDEDQLQNQSLETGVPQQTQNHGTNITTQDQELNENAGTPVTVHEQKQDEHQNTNSNTQLTQDQSESDQIPTQTQNNSPSTDQLQTDNQSGIENVGPDNSNNSQKTSGSEEKKSTPSSSGSSSGYPSGKSKGNG